VPWLWAVPVVAAAVGVAVLLARLRSIEALSVDLAREARRTAELRPPMADIRRHLDRSGPIVDRLWSHWTDEASAERSGRPPGDEPLP
jgi:hypothetical protein